MLPNLRLHCSSMPNILAFKTPHVRCILVFGVLNAKYLAFGTPNASALLQLYFLSFTKLQDFVVANSHLRG